MLEGLLTRQPQVMTSRDREAQYFLCLLDEVAEPCLAVKTLRIRLLGDFALLANDLPVTSLDMPRLYRSDHNRPPLLRDDLAKSFPS